ncbi:hypothetical protein MMC18_001358 [Xylographa bjoerkii]|nr:hypothetical protein [Xylographa bjoerkii]
MTFLKGQLDGNQSDYLVHPITIDSMLQTAIIASAKGDVKSLQGRVPIMIGHLHVIVDPNERFAGPVLIRGTAEKVGLTNFLLHAEIEDLPERVLLSMENVRVVPFSQTLLDPNQQLERNPALKISWKPDISAFNSKDVEGLTHLVNRFKMGLTHGLAGGGLIPLAWAMDLAYHQNPNMRILELESEADNFSNELSSLLTLCNPTHRYSTYFRASLTEDKKLYGCEIFQRQTVDTKTVDICYDKSQMAFDTIIIPPSILERVLQDEKLIQLHEFLEAGGFLISMDTSSRQLLSDQSCFSFVSIGLDNTEERLLIAQKMKENPILSKITAKIILVHADEWRYLNTALKTGLQEIFEQEVEFIHFNDVRLAKLPSQSIIISTVELEFPLLNNLTVQELESLKVLTDSAGTLLWITAGNYYKAAHPTLALALGFARALMVERPTLKMATLDLDSVDRAASILCRNVTTILLRILSQSKPDLELLTTRWSAVY